MTDEEIYAMIAKLAGHYRGRDGRTDLKAVRARLELHFTNAPELVIRWIVKGGGALRRHLAPGPGAQGCFAAAGRPPLTAPGLGTRARGAMAFPGAGPGPR